MKLLHVLPTIDPESGGPIEGVRQSGLYLQSCGHSVEVVTLDEPGRAFIQEFPLTVYALGPSWGGYAFNRRLVPWLRANASRFDAVIVDGIWQYNCFGTWRALRNSATSYFVFTHGMLDPWFKRTFPLKHLKKWLYWPWGVYPAIRDARAVLFTCEEERTLARQSFWLYRAKEAVVRFGTAPPPPSEAAIRDEFLAKFPELKRRRIVLFLGRIHEKKGCDIAINAFARVAAVDPMLHLVIAGSGNSDLVGKLKSLASNLGIENRITWTGMLTGRLKWAAFFCSEIFVLPSHQENFGIAVAEALGCGLPVLISDKVNIWREISEQNAGLVSPDSVDGTELSLRKWLSMNPHDYRVMKSQALTTFRNCFSIEAMGSSMISVIGSAIGRG